MLAILELGGPILWVIVLGSVLGLAVFLERLFHLHRAQIKTDDFLSGIINVLKRNSIAEAVTIADDTPGPVAHLVHSAVVHHDQPMAIEQALIDAGRSEIPRLEKNIGFLGLLGTIMPLLGLLGTILGMIEAFMTMEQQAPLVHVGHLAGGLWQALSTTAAGLIVAIVCAASSSLLRARSQSIICDMEHAANQILRFFRSGLTATPGAS